MNLLSNISSSINLINAVLLYAFLIVWIALLTLPVFVAMIFMGIPVYVGFQGWRSRVKACQTFHHGLKLGRGKPRKRFETAF